MMWKKTFLALLMVNTAWAATEPHNPPSIAELQQEAQQAELTRQRQRQTFLQLESLLQTAEKQGRVSDHLLALVERLQDKNYPLFDELQWDVLKAKLTREEAKDPAILNVWISDFVAKYPEIAKRNKLEQSLFPAYFARQQLAELVKYAEKVAPEGNNQCLLLAAKFQLLAEQLQLNPEAEQANNALPNADKMNELLAEFETFWQQSENLPSECGGIEAYWRDQGRKTPENIQQKAVNLFQKNSSKGLEALATNAPAELAEGLAEWQKLLNTPANLPAFAENRPVNSWNKTVLLETFPRFIKTLPEQLENPNFSRYQHWAERWGLSESEQREWKIAFINRLFDNADPIFQLWRDEQILALNADNLTERRLRMAIWQQTDLTPWLAVLSSEGKEKAEWRYWQGKADPNKRQSLLSTLAKERGFYAMLAADQLKQPYQPTLPKVTPLTAAQQQAFAQPLAKVAELRALERFGAAKQGWVELLQAVKFEEKIALADYAVQQDWFDLAVEATIVAKAWDYLPLRLPNAYADWFAANLVDSPISPSFAMAIARQESAWNPQARSHANAMGLMQMLPSTAEITAKNSDLPYQNERELLSPLKNILLGTTHLAELNAKYPHNRILIAAAYNAGASRVEKWLERAGGRLAMDEFIASIPFYETRGYVQNVLTYDFYYQMLYGKTGAIFSPEEQRSY